MQLQEMGFSPKVEKLAHDLAFDSFSLGRVISEHKERYVVATENGDVDAEITGNLRFTAQCREDFPAVGDWVALIQCDQQFAVIHKIMPRFSAMKRQSVKNRSESQIIASNIDVALLVQSVDRDFNINRLERYLAICYSSTIEPIIVFTKVDLYDKEHLSKIISHTKQRLPNIPVFTISNATLEGLETLKMALEKGKTYCMIGSSGAGKSTLLNNLTGRQLMSTGAISKSTGKGRHTTSHRELTVLDSGAIIIDNPGMREAGLADASEGIETMFDQISTLAKNCRFSNCTHTSEKGCAIIEALENGTLDQAAHENLMKMQKEQKRYELSVEEKHRTDKIFGKMLKNYKKESGKDKF